MAHYEQRRVNAKDEWLTPPELIKSLGKFDLDPCAPINRPWNTAAMHYTKSDDGLAQEWVGRVWCNPLYGAQAAQWLHKCMLHGNAIALVFARTETQMFHDYVFNKADAILFIKGRLQFYHVNGFKKPQNSPSPSALIAYGQNNVEALRNCKMKGKLLLMPSLFTEL